MLLLKYVMLPSSAALKTPCTQMSLCFETMGFLLCFWNQNQFRTDRTNRLFLLTHSQTNKKKTLIHRYWFLPTSRQFFSAFTATKNLETTTGVVEEIYSNFDNGRSSKLVLSTVPSRKVFASSRESKQRFSIQKLQWVTLHSAIQRHLSPQLYLFINQRNRGIIKRIITLILLFDIRFAASLSPLQHGNFLFNYWVTNKFCGLIFRNWLLIIIIFSFEY